jgi:hypothetical protein
VPYGGYQIVARFCFFFFALDFDFLLLILIFSKSAKFFPKAQNHAKKA